MQCVGRGSESLGLWWWHLLTKHSLLLGVALRNSSADCMVHYPMYSAFLYVWCIIVTMNFISVPLCVHMCVEGKGKIWYFIWRLRCWVYFRIELARGYFLITVELRFLQNLTVFPVNKLTGKEDFVLEWSLLFNTHFSSVILECEKHFTSRRVWLVHKKWWLQYN